MDNKSTVSLCIVTYNNSDKIGIAVSSIANNTKLPYTLYISDNGSCDDTIEKVLYADPTAVILKNNENLGFGKGHNKVLPLIDSKYHAVVNPDISFDYDVVKEICDYMDAHPEVVMATPKVLMTDGTEQLLPKRRPTIKYLAARRLHLSKRLSDEYSRANEVFTEPTEIDFCTGCFFIMRTDVFKTLKGFDDRFFMYMEDADITLRALEYGKVMFLPHSHITHGWEKSSAKSFKYFMIHLSSMIKFLWKHRRNRGKKI